MRAIEFVANVEDGVIKVPKKYQAQLGDNFRVIILQEESSTAKKKSGKKRSLTAFRITTKDLKFDRDEANER
ncbi:hypothetical protein A3F66_02740 [candidate division TM6 bacterium RIFCSPHIGHO2_12_FULL_32_22]|nr:MAG: hypothetical protein A3F66_02740 [candidate division TM6 bacterium RIFCSPHIGHO2_12_FULL_32_22]